MFRNEALPKDGKRGYSGVRNGIGLTTDGDIKKDPKNELVTGGKSRHIELRTVDFPTREA
jgi:hypothetical protein